MTGKSHESVMTHARKILENDHHDTYAFMARAFESDLIRGNSFADSTGVPQYITIDLCSIWTFGQSVHTWKIDLSNTSSFEHYYDPETDQGLNLSAYGNVETLVESIGVLGGILFGAAGFYIDVSAHPNLNFNVPYKSAADLCQEQYDLALAIWRGDASSETGYAWGDAMFHLGWACHMLADLSTSPHTSSSRFMDHNGFEEEFDKYIENEQLHALHISNVLSNYHIGASVRQIAAEAARDAHEELFLYDDHSWEDAILLAIPRAEIYTARILAKFFYEAGIAQVPAAFQINTRALDETRIANAAVFYRKPGHSWKTIITDSMGTAELTLPANENIQLRPAHPGYLFKGNYTGDAPSIPEFHQAQSPVPYTHAADPNHKPSIVLRMKPCQNMQHMAEIMTLLPGMFIVKEIYRTPRPNVVQRAEGELVEILVMGSQIGTQPELKIDSPEPAHICVRVYSLLDILTANFVKNKTEFQHMIMNSRRMRRMHEPAGIPEHHETNMEHGTRERIRPSEEILEAVKRTQELDDRLQETRASAQNVKYKDSFLRKVPAIMVNAPGHHNIKVEVVQSPGYVGYGCNDPGKLETTTNPFEEAWIKIYAGNQAGRLKLNITVSPADNEYIGEAEEISKTVEMWVLPKDSGEMDEDQLRAPQLSAGF